MPASTRNTMGPYDGDELQQHVDRFVTAWSAAAPDQAVDLAGFLPTPGSGSRLAVLRQLIPIDLEHRWQRNRRALLEDYVRCFPELDGNKGPPPDLVYEEFRVRHLHGDRPDPSEYQRRFPAAFDSFRRILDESPLSSILMDAARTPLTLGLNPAVSVKPSAIAPSLSRPGFVLPSSSGYRLLKRLGRGSYGEVWKAEAPGGVPVAVKIISHSLDTAESQQELKALELIRELHHPYLTQTHAFWTMEDRLVIVMDLADSSLSDRFKVCTEKDGLPGIPLAELSRYIAQSAEALDFMHAYNIQHRDIKPENILLVQGNVKVADFGLAKLKDQRMLMSATSAGTPAYMAPEVWKRQVSAASDQYSLAGTYLFLRRGRQPFNASNFWALMHAHLQDKPDLDDLLPAESVVLARALAKDPLHRYPSCSEFALALRGALAPSTETPPVEVRRPWPSGGALLAVLTAMVLLAGFILLSILQPILNRPAISDELKADEPWLPAGGFVGAADAEVRSVGGRKLYSRIELRRFEPAATFLLMEKRPEEPNDPPVFYMMETEVPHKFFESVAASPEYRDRLRRLDEDKSWLAPGEWVKGWDVPSPGKLKPDHPVTRVTVTEAYWCAEAVGCNLPTVEQWLRAAGKSRSANGPKGPYEEPYQADEIAVGRAGRGPLAVGTARKDRVPSTGCKDMAGNVTEWTRNLAEGMGMVPVVNPKRENLLIFALGNNYVDQTPYVFQGLEQEQVFPLDWKENNLGFRLVLELP